MVRRPHRSMQPRIPPSATSAHSARTTCAPSPIHLVLQDHGGFARHNQFGTFRVKNEQNKTETSPKFQKTKTTKTEQKTTDKLPTAGQRVVHFRALAYALTIIGVAAACGLSVCPPLVLALHTHCACTPLCASCHSWLSLALVWPCRVAPTCTPLRSTLSSAFITLSSNWRRVACVPAPRSASTRVSRRRQARPPNLACLRAAPFRRSGCRCSRLRA